MKITRVACPMSERRQAAFLHHARPRTCRDQFFLARSMTIEDKIGQRESPIMGSEKSKIKLDRNAKDDLRLVVEHSLDQYLQTFAPTGTHAVLWRQHGYEARVFFPVVIKPRGARLEDSEQQLFRRSYTRYSHQFNSNVNEYKNFTYKAPTESDFPSVAYFLFPETAEFPLYEVRFESKEDRLKATAQRKLHLAVSIFTNAKPRRFDSEKLIHAAQWLKQLEHIVDAWDSAEILWLSHMRYDGNPPASDTIRQDILHDMLTQVIDYACDRDPSPPFSSPLWWMGARYGADSLYSLNPLYLNAIFTQIAHYKKEHLIDYSKERHSKIVKALGSSPNASADWDLLKLPNGRLVFRCKESVREEKLSTIATELRIPHTKDVCVQDERTGGGLALYGGIIDLNHKSKAKFVLEETALAAGRSFDAFERTMTVNAIDAKVTSLLNDLRFMTNKIFEEKNQHNPGRMSNELAMKLQDKASNAHYFLIKEMRLCIPGLRSAARSLNQIEWSPDRILHVLVSIKELQCKQNLGIYLLRLWISMLNGFDPIGAVLFPETDYRRSLKLPTGITAVRLLSSLHLMHAEGARDFGLVINEDNWTITVTIPAEKGTGLGILAQAFDYGLHGGNLRKAMEPWLKIIEGSKPDPEFSLKVDGQFGSSWKKNSVKVSFQGKLMIYHSGRKRPSGTPPLQPSSDSSEAQPVRGQQSSGEAAPPPDDANAPSALAIYVIDPTTDPNSIRAWPSNWLKFSDFKCFEQAVNQAARHVIVCHSPSDIKHCRSYKKLNPACIAIISVTGGNEGLTSNARGYYSRYLVSGQDDEAQLGMNSFVEWVYTKFTNETKR